ncbi:hypothetical protein [Clostridium paraputrificum]|uniref:hypothetical protein n=1 Tax=Clostridium paraputrificum TaxID=29363 RepID=UPI00189D4C43|nr:hypothetical protein [Clostridium paraputrificum]
MNKCPRCENENLKEDYNYCPVCGVNLGTAPEVPVQEQSSSKLKANFTIKGLDTLINSTDSFLNIDTICTNKTSVEVNLFES